MAASIPCRRLGEFSNCSAEKYHIVSLSGLKVVAAAEDAAAAAAAAVVEDVEELLAPEEY